MRKSSLSHRNSNVLPSERRSRGRSTDGSRSSLLQPGFASKHRRSSSHDGRDSGVGLLSRRSNLPIRRSKSQLSMALPSSVTPRRETISPCPSRTPADGSRSVARSHLGTSQKPRKDPRNLSDKGQYAAAVAQITNFFVQRGKPLNFRQPLTVKAFLDATMLLLGELGIQANLTSANYIEEIPFHLKILSYPGSLAPSWLKTAYAQHSLTHVMSMLSWLVELIESTNTTPLFKEEDNDGFKILPAKDYFEMFSAAHVRWNAFQSEDEIIQEFQEKLALTYIPNIDDASLNAIITEIQTLAAKCQPEKEISDRKKELDETLQHLNSDISKLQAHLKNTKKFCATLENKIQSLESKKGETEGKVVNIQCLTDQLRKQVSNQEMSKDDLNEVLQTCEHLRGRIRSGEKCFTDLQEMAFKLDREIVHYRAKFNEKMEHFNNVLVMGSCSLPELSQLQIKSNVLAATYMEEIQELDSALSALHKDLSSKKSNIHEEFVNLQSLLDEVIQRCNIISEENTNLMQKIRQLEDRISSLKTRMSENETKVREEEKYLQDGIAKQVNSQELVDLKQKLDVKTAEHEKILLDTKEMVEKAEHFFKESVSITMSFVREVRKLRAQKEERLKKMIELKEAQRSKRK